MVWYKYKGMRTQVKRYEDNTNILVCGRSETRPICCPQQLSVYLVGVVGLFKGDECGEPSALEDGEYGAEHRY
jgi:hypothetical protein